MTGRSSCMDQPDKVKNIEEISQYIPVQQCISLPSLDTNPQLLQPFNYPTESNQPPPPLEAPSFQDPNYPPPHIETTEETVSSTSVKLPPISSPRMAPRNINEVKPLLEETKMPFMDMRQAYETMMMNYFLPQPLKQSYVPEKYFEEYPLPQNTQRHTQQAYNPAYVYHSTSQPFPPYGFPKLPPSSTETRNNRILPYIVGNNCNQKMIPQNSCTATHSSAMYATHSTMDVTSSGCRLLETNLATPLNNAQNKAIVKPQSHFESCAQTTSESGTAAAPESQSQGSLLTNGDESTNLTDDMSTVLSNLCMFMPPSETRQSELERVPFNATSGSTMSNQSVTTSSACSYGKPEQNWGRFSVLPPVNRSTSVSNSEGDNLSLSGYNSIPSNAQNSSQMGMYYSSFSPFAANFSDNISSAFAASPRYSARSSYSGRGSRNKRALSNSPLSAEGIDLNSIIRMSPTSLHAYINGSRSSSSCISPSSLGDKTGCYGHLSARNSSSSPHSGSGSSGNRRSSSYTPAGGTPSNNLNRNNTSDNNNACDISKNDLLDIDQNMLVIQAMQELEAGIPMTSLGGMAFENTPAQLPPEFENLQIMPQDMAAFRTEDYIRPFPAVLPPAPPSFISPNTLPSPQPLKMAEIRTKPPPSYDQHMARKATLQKNSSSDSSQPSNSSSFESSEGDKTSGGTDSEGNKIYTCKWLDCICVFHDQEEFVSHIEKVHVDQRKGEDFVCFWKLCPRRLHPFNARYKLLVHMRVHSGDKPNKCTYAGCKKAFSRLENLKIHLRSHTGERPYACTHPGCTKTFSNSSDRTKHQKTHHDTKPYACQVPGCDKRYTDPSSLRKHVKKTHPENNEPGRKKIRGGVEELDHKDLNECLVIQGIKPITIYEASPPEPTDSGLGRSPRGSQPPSSIENYSGFLQENPSRSGTTRENSCHASPSSQHSSPSILNEREKPHNNNLRVPILPPISGASPVAKNRSGIRSRSASTNITSHRASTSMSTSGNINSNIISTSYDEPLNNINALQSFPSGYQDSKINSLPRYDR